MDLMTNATAHMQKNAQGWKNVQQGTNKKSLNMSPLFLKDLVVVS